jgi:hypothetical protein
MYQRRGGDDELAVARGHPPVGQDGGVLQAGANAVAVMDLFELKTAFGERPLDGPCVGDCLMGFGVERLDQGPRAARRDPRSYEGARVFE